MKAVEKEIEVPATSRKLVSYLCEESGCGFETDDERDAQKHYGCEHAVKAEHEIGDFVFLRFDLEGDFLAFIESTAGLSTDRVYGTWSGSGWYAKEFGSERCGSGCCSNTTLTLRFADAVLSDWRRRAARLESEVTQLRDLAETNALV